MMWNYYDMDLKTRLIMIGILVGILVITLIVEKVKNKKDGK